MFRVEEGECDLTQINIGAVRRIQWSHYILIWSFYLQTVLPSSFHCLPNLYDLSLAPICARDPDAKICLMYPYSLAFTNLNQIRVTCSSNNLIYYFTCNQCDGFQPPIEVPTTYAFLLPCTPNLTNSLTCTCTSEPPINHLQSSWTSLPIYSILWQSPSINCK